MEKRIFTFGSGQLTEFSVKPESVMLVVEGVDWLDCREQVFNYNGIGAKFCTDYAYDDYVDEFKNDYFMKEYTFADLEKLRYGA